MMKSKWMTFDDPSFDSSEPKTKMKLIKIENEKN